MTGGARRGVLPPSQLRRGAASGGQGGRPPDNGARSGCAVHQRCARQAGDRDQGGRAGHGPGGERGRGAGGDEPVAIDPRWPLYLPPTMAPCATSAQPGLLEHPAEAFAAYAADGIAEVICEEKHMGSRAIVLACRDDPPAGAASRFAAAGDRAGCGVHPDRAAVLRPGAVPAAAGRGPVRDRRRRAVAGAGYQLAAAGL